MNIKETEQLKPPSDLEIYVIGNLEKDFLKKRNEVMRRSEAPLVMLLNTDIKVSNFEPALALFERDPNLFAITFSPESSGTGRVKEAEFANGGSSVYRRSIWNEIGGIDLMFEPYWWDDVDYSYTARMAGYKILEDGRVKVTKQGEMGVQILSRNPKAVFGERRNRLLFLMKHKPDEYRKVKQNPAWWPFVLAAEIRFKKFHPQG